MWRHCVNQTCRRFRPEKELQPFEFNGKTFWACANNTCLPKFIQQQALVRVNGEDNAP